MPKAKTINGLVAQLDRASACGAEGRRFDPCRGHHDKTNISFSKNARFLSFMKEKKQSSKFFSKEILVLFCHKN